MQGPTDRSHRAPTDGGTRRRHRPRPETRRETPRRAGRSPRVPGDAQRWPRRAPTHCRRQPQRSAREQALAQTSTAGDGPRAPGAIPAGPARRPRSWLPHAEVDPPPTASEASRPPTTDCRPPCRAAESSRPGGAPSSSRAIVSTSFGVSASSRIKRAPAARTSSRSWSSDRTR